MPHTLSSHGKYGITDCAITGPTVIITIHTENTTNADHNKQNTDIGTEVEKDKL